MAKAGFRKRRYYFTDNSIAVDTIIAFALGGVALLAEIIGIIFSIATKGNTPDIFGTIYLCAIILSIVGLLFASYGRNAQEGGVRSKRWSSFVCTLALAIPVIMIISGFFK